MRVERPFFNSKIDELSREYSDRMNDIRFLELLVHELGFRSTVAARNLQKQASARIELLRKQTAPASPAVAKSEPGSKASAPEPPLHQPARLAEWPGNLMAAWTALEVLSPQTFRKVEDIVDGDHRRVARIDRTSLPWENGGERSVPNKKLFYQLLLGVVRVGEAADELVSRYKESSPEFLPVSGYTPIAVVVLDQAGVPVADDPVVISSFAWAWRPALEGRLAELGHWGKVEGKLCEELQKKLVRKSEEDELLPLDSETIRAAFDFLCVRLGLDPSVVDEPQYALRTYQFFRIADPPEPILLNSFFVKDLLMAGEHIAAGTESASLRQFVRQSSRSDRIDLLTNPEALELAVR